MSADPTTTAQVDTTLPETTTEPQETTTTTETPTSTSLPDGVPPRVTFPDDPERQAVVDAAYAYFDALRAASADPSNETLRASLASTIEEPVASRVLAFVDKLVADGERVIENRDQPTYIEILDFTVDTLDDSATFDACVVDADIRIAPGAGLGGRDLVVDESISSAAQTYQLVRVDGVWRVQDIVRFSRWEGQVGCG